MVRYTGLVSITFSTIILVFFVSHVIKSIFFSGHNGASLQEKPDRPRKNLVVYLP